MPRKTRTWFQDQYYGYPVDLIAEWCCVDLKSAMHFKSGTRSPGKAALQLFLLNRDGRIVPAEWEGFSFRSGKIWDPWGKELTAGQLRAYPVALQMLSEWAKGDLSRRRRIDDVMRLATVTDQPRSGLLLSGPERGAQRSEAPRLVEAKPSALVRPRPPQSVRQRISRRRASTTLPPSPAGYAEPPGGTER